MSSMQETIINAFNFRHATKEFDPEKKVSESDFHTILETGRLSPSSLGLEPWRFVVIENEDLKEKLKPYSWGAQKQLNTSRFVIILARKNVTADSEYVQHIIRGIKNTKKVRFRVEDKFNNFKTNFHINDNERTLLDWASKQTYIALANMMTSALLGIDSCPMEGFDLDKVTEILVKKMLSIRNISHHQLWLHLVIEKKNQKIKFVNLPKTLLNGFNIGLKRE